MSLLSPDAEAARRAAENQKMVNAQSRIFSLRESVSEARSNINSAVTGDCTEHYDSRGQPASLLMHPNGASKLTRSILIKELFRFSAIVQYYNIDEAEICWRIIYEELFPW
jgi:hypothetical protein